MENKGKQFDISLASINHTLHTGKSDRRIESFSGGSLGKCIKKGREGEGEGRKSYSQLVCPETLVGVEVSFVVGREGKENIVFFWFAFGGGLGKIGA